MPNSTRQSLLHWLHSQLRFLWFVSTLNIIFKWILIMQNVLYITKNTFCAPRFYNSWCFQALWSQWSVKVWKRLPWRQQKTRVSLRLIFPETMQKLSQRSVLWNFLGGQIICMLQRRTRSLKLWREKRKTLTQSLLLLVFWDRVPKTENARLLRTSSVHPKLWIFLCLQSGVWHPPATIFLFFPSLEYLSVSI